MTYGDGVADVDIRALLDTHRKNGTVATLTGVRPTSRFGELKLENDRVASFHEKESIEDVWINGGIYVANARSILNHLPEKGDIEKETFPKLVGSGELMAYPYRGFWSLIDSIKDIQEVETEFKSRAARPN